MSNGDLGFLIIELDGERFKVKRTATGWSKPIPFDPKIGEKISVADITKNDAVLIPAYALGGRNGQRKLFNTFSGDRIEIGIDTVVIFDGERADHERR